MLEIIFDYLVGFLSMVGLIVIVMGAFFLYYERVDRKKAERELYK